MAASLQVSERSFWEYMYMVYGLKWKFKTWHKKNGFAYSRVDKVIKYVFLLLTQLAITHADSINNQSLYFSLTWK